MSEQQPVARGSLRVDEYVRPITRPRGPWHALASEHAAIAHAACGWAKETSSVERRREYPGGELVCRRCADDLAHRAVPPG